MFLPFCKMENYSIGISSALAEDESMVETSLPRIDLAGVGARVDALREATGLEKGIFAETAGIDASSYSKIIKGEKPLKADMAYVLSLRWSVPMDFFYRGTLDGLPGNLSAKIIAALMKKQP